MIEQDKIEAVADERLFLKSALPENLGAVQVHVHVPQIPVQQASLPARIGTKLLPRISATSNLFTRNIKREIEHGTPFLFVPVWLGLGAVLYFIANFEPNAIVLLVTILVLMVLRWLVRQSRALQALTTILLCVAVGAGCAKLQSWRNSTPMLAGEITTLVTARIVSINHTAKSHRAILEVLATEKPALKYAPKGVRVTLRGEIGLIQSGDMIKVKLRLMPPSGPVRPTSYDFAFQAYFDGIGATGFSIGPVVKLESEKANFVSSIKQALEHLRQTIAARIRAVLSGSEAEVAVALIAGVQTGIDEDTMEALRMTGLAHVLSISGLHMALVAGLFMVLIRGGMALFPNQAARFPVKKYAAFLALAACFFYLMLSGADVAAMRAFLMLSVFLVAMFFDQQALTMRNLALSAIAILIVTPHEIMGPSFQMSFAATAALISAYAYWSNRDVTQQVPSSQGLVGQVMGKLGRFVLGLAATSVIAGLATSLYSAWHFHRLAPLGLPTNLAAMPPVSLIVMPFAVLSAAAMPFGLEAWPLRCMGFGIELMLEAANYFATISPLGVSGAVTPPALLIATSGLLIVCLMQTGLKWLALLPAALSFFVWQPDKPDLLISEDAKLVAVRTKEGLLAVNRNRPNAFTIEAWQRANMAEIVTPATPNNGPVFKCIENICELSSENGLHITWIGYPKPQKTDAGQPVTDREIRLGALAAKFEASSKTACGKTDLLIVEGPASPRLCRGTETYVISAQDLGSHGSAEVYFNSDLSDGSAQMPKFQVRYSIPTPNRPWNYERKFSRAARNMEPFVPLP